MRTFTNEQFLMNWFGSRGKAAWEKYKNDRSERLKRAYNKINSDLEEKIQEINEKLSKITKEEVSSSSYSEMLEIIDQDLANFQEKIQPKIYNNELSPEYFVMTLCTDQQIKQLQSLVKSQEEFDELKLTPPNQFLSLNSFEGITSYNDLEKTFTELNDEVKKLNEQLKSIQSEVNSIRKQPYLILENFYKQELPKMREELHSLTCQFENKRIQMELLPQINEESIALQEKFNKKTDIQQRILNYMKERSKFAFHSNESSNETAKQKFIRIMQLFENIFSDQYYSEFQIERTIRFIFDSEFGIKRMSMPSGVLSSPNKQKYDNLEPPPTI